MSLVLCFYVLSVLCRSVYCLCVNVYCTAATGGATQLQLTNITYHMGFSNYMSLRMLMYRSIAVALLGNKIYRLKNTVVF